MKNWIVVANSAQARVLEAADGSGDAGGAPFVHLADLVHPQSRQRGSELASDRPGQAMGGGHSPGGTSYGPRTDPREREHERFAHELAEFIDHGVAEGRCAGLVLVAASPFLGRLKGQLGKQATKAVMRTLAVDCTTLDEKALAERLRSNGGGLA